MKLLFVTSQYLNVVSNNHGPQKNNFGGWLTNMLNELKKDFSITLGVVMVNKDGNNEKKNIDGITYYICKDSSKKDISIMDRDWVINDFKPDIIHIEGNEFPIHERFSEIRDIPILLSLQGILDGYSQYQYGGLNLLGMLFGVKEFMPVTALILILKKKFTFNNRIKLERKTISNVKYITGRTFWDYAYAYKINKNFKYFKCNRILRNPFYSESWNYDDVEKNTIYVGNGYAPLKGLSYVLDTLYLLKSDYPDVKLYLSGNSPIVKKFGIKSLGYSHYIKKKIKKLNLESNIVFLGELNASQMIYYMKKSNVYLLPSLIENSPNTLGEAMILGMPCVSAYTGGVSDMAVDEKECLFYRATESTLCALQIKRIFDDKKLAISLGKNAKKHARITHDPIENSDKLKSIYKSILGEKNG